MQQTLYYYYSKNSDGFLIMNIINTRHSKENIIHIPKAMRSIAEQDAEKKIEQLIELIATSKANHGLEPMGRKAVEKFRNQCNKMGDRKAKAMVQAIVGAYQNTKDGNPSADAAKLINDIYTLKVVVGEVKRPVQVCAYLKLQGSMEVVLRGSLLRGSQYWSLLVQVKRAHRSLGLNTTHTCPYHHRKSRRKRHRRVQQIPP
eukprot:TRINITY_DN26680_c0_g1_i2.p1 TRINITY_DN26680_c0_g1~~TRINITY_DN26680_c0_g1_i2.p1  ORF type:complete len:202 (-),score=4.54 TRINITY_DN26680_c0_g1_i2:436-1041(-)